MAKAFKFDPAKPWGSYPKRVKDRLLYGAPNEEISFKYGSGSSRGSYRTGWEGVLGNVERRYQETSSDAVRSQMDAYMTEKRCDACEGHRLRPDSLSVRLAGKGIGEAVDLSVDGALSFFESVPLGKRRPHQCLFQPAATQRSGATRVRVTVFALIR